MLLAPRSPMPTPKPSSTEAGLPQLAVAEACPFLWFHIDLLYICRISTNEKESWPQVGFTLLWEGQNLVQVLS